MRSSAAALGFRETVYPHGTRSRYVSNKCRCDECRRANLDYYHARVKARCEAAASVRPSRKPGSRILERAGKPYRVRTCPGANGRRCVKRGAWLRTGGDVCTACIDRATVWNGLISAAPVREHLERLSQVGVGYKSVAEACDVGKTTLMEIRAGTKTKIRRLIAERILAVTPAAVADHGLVDAAPTQKLIEDLVQPEVGFSKAEIARRLGYKTPALQMSRKRVLAKTEQRLRRFYRSIMVG